MEIKDLPQLEEATESDHVVSSISQKTRLISFKNIFEKISFSSLVTTAKNIIGSINELKGRCDTLDTSVSKLNTDLKNSEITVNRTNQVWIAKSYTEYVVCEYTIQSAGVYLAVAKTMVGDYKTDRAFSFELNQNSTGNGSGIVLNGNGAYMLLAPMSYIFTCTAGDKIYTTAQANYVADGEAYAGLATGCLKLIKLHS